MNVLIVDDSKIIRRVLTHTVTRYFQQNGWGVINLFEAENGVEAMDIMKKETIDIIFLDWNMPIMNGEEVVDAVRAEKNWNKTRIIMATTEGSKASVLKVIKKGVNAYLVKPFNEPTIYKTLDTVTARMQKQ
jgi:two-component system chemotaxis response regulator CheY